MKVRISSDCELVIVESQPSKALVSEDVTSRRLWVLRFMGGILFDTQSFVS